MVDRFIALPVGQGDAFFYQRDNLKILVDGGRSKKNFPKLVDKHLKIKEIDIIICTHNDADHTNGLIGLLKEQKVRINQVWLPGSWSYKLKELLENPDSFFLELVEDISKIPNEKLSTLENLAIFTEKFFQELDNELLLRLCNQNTTLAYSSCSDLLILEPSSWWSQPKRINLWLSAINAADRIKKIAYLAYDRQIRIRWFDFDEFKRKGQSSGGEKNILEPVNAFEILPQTIKISALKYLYLTVDNKKSIVFLSPENNKKLGVLFTGDSDFKLFNIQHQSPILPMIVTTPHHGSDNNKNAYKVINSWHNNPSSLIWVRSDQINNSPNKGRPGHSFRTISGQRLCTICRPPSNHTKQAVELFHSQSGFFKWFWHSNVRNCQCK
jgi:ribonuclease BN (tRNA processing enzyme)